MAEEICPVCKGTDVDDYGCLDCFMHAAAGTWLEEDWAEDTEYDDEQGEPIDK